MHGVFKRPSERSARPRVGRLSVLPVFLDLNGKRALIAGGSEAAHWKAELFAAAGAEVHVFAPKEELCEDFAALLEDGTFIHHDQIWNEDIFAGMTIAVADAACEDEARAFQRAAIAAGVPVNVIDRPEFCGLQFGSIVNRSPVVIGISTAGAAPILAQAIRSKIETLLPHSLTAWAQWAQTMRRAINTRLLAGASRRAFWEDFVTQVFSKPFTQSEGSSLLQSAERIAARPAQSVGRITLVDTGSGDMELLTIKALRALQSADVILFGDRVAGETLELGRREARRIKVDIDGECFSEDLKRLGALAIEFAKCGKHVVALVPADPTSSDCANLEIERLMCEGYAAEIVPGVRSICRADDATLFGTRKTRQNYHAV